MSKIPFGVCPPVICILPCKTTTFQDAARLLASDADHVSFQGTDGDKQSFGTENGEGERHSPKPRTPPPQVLPGVKFLFRTGSGRASPAAQIIDSKFCDFGF